MAFPKVNFVKYLLKVLVLYCVDVSNICKLRLMKYNANYGVHRHVFLFKELIVHMVNKP